MDDREELAGYVEVWWQAINDFLDLLESRRLTPATVASTLRGAWDAHARLTDVTGVRRDRARVVTASASVIGAAWAAFALAAAGVAKSTEDPPFAAASRGHDLISLTRGSMSAVFALLSEQNADFARMGVMHRNTYLPANHMLEATMKIRADRSDAPLFFAGQLTGVEGYTESTAMGHIAGTNAARLARGEDLLTMPQGTMMGALAHYITTKEGTLQPINSNWGLVPTVPKKENGKRLTKPERRQRQSQTALTALDEFLAVGRGTVVAG